MSALPLFNSSLRNSWAPQFGGFDTLPDDVPAIPPGLLQDFSTSGTCPHTG